MTSVQKAIFPGIAIGCLFLVLFTSLIAKPQIALASNQETGQNLLAQVVSDAAQAQNSTPEEEQPVVQEAAAEAAPPAETQPQEAAQAADAECSVSVRYPETIRQWCGYIQKYSIENGLDPNLVAAVMMQESGGDADAYSKSGAVGLLQVMPRDGLAASFMCINGPCFGSRPSMAELYDPEFNISYGTNMLAGLIDRHGNARDALRSYGPMNVGYYYADLVLNILRNHE